LLSHGARVAWDKQGGFNVWRTQEKPFDNAVLFGLQAVAEVGKAGLWGMLFPHWQREERQAELYSKAHSAQRLTKEKKMPEIKFSHNYPKLHGQTKGKLLSVEAIPRKKLDPDFVEYDTFIEPHCHYPLPNGTVIVLIFSGDKRIPFTTIRSYGASKIMGYESCIGQVFDVVIVPAAAVPAQPEEPNFLAQ
jgi:hypothetical protein